jgi:FAD/FMN-containing dehydrogenase
MMDRANLRLKIETIVGANNVIFEEQALEPYVTEWRGLWRGTCDLVVKPGTTQEVSEVVSICYKNDIPITPLSGNTGLVGGGVPDGGIVLSTERLNRVRNIDPLNFTMTCEAGCILSNIQNAADDAGRLFPLSLAAEGSCCIGGNLSTNAGGVQVLRYGNTRDLVLGLEVVLPNGDIWDGLRGLRKDNTGYDLKHLFVGAEGTLGIITAAVLKLYPQPRQKETALIALASQNNAIELFSRTSAGVGEALSAFELMNALSFELSINHVQENRSPFSDAANCYVLMELSSAQEGSNLRDALESVLESCFEDEIVLDAVLAESSTQSADFWRIRESIPDSQASLGGSIKNDITVPISRVAEFLERAGEAVGEIIPDTRIVSFGHVGDGNLHYNISQPVGMDKQAYLDRWHDITDVLNDIVADLNGSFSAEHGIGQLKRRELSVYRSEIEVGLMKDIKKKFDPKNIMNPGKLFLD